MQQPFCFFVFEPKKNPKARTLSKLNKYHKKKHLSLLVNVVVVVVVVVSVTREEEIVWIDLFNRCFVSLSWNLLK